MTKIQWKFLVDYWSDEKFKENSKKASESRAHQKMPHYNITKSFARLRQEIDEIKKLKEQRDLGLNDKRDEQIFQDVLGKDAHGYLRAYALGKSITEHFKVKPSRLDLSQEQN
ncbi:4-hydroxy-3-methylbut-2-enyl diphosphate reductase [Bienertia sinuspersici]